MKNLHFKKTRKLLLVLVLVTFLLTPIYSIVNANGYIWEIDFEDCINCGECLNYTDLIALGDEDAYFIDGNIIGGSSFYLDYSPDIDPCLQIAMDMCPTGALIFDTY